MVAPNKHTHDTAQDWIKGLSNVIHEMNREEEWLIKVILENSIFENREELTKKMKEDLCQ